MSSSTERESLLRKQQELLTELEQLEDVTEENDVMPEARLADIRRELKDIERRLDPESADHRRHDGRSDADLL
jgi:hypothetical protein